MKTSTLAIAAAVLLLSLVAVLIMEARQPPPVELIPTLTGQPEYCLTCHAELPEISAAHPIQTFGCVLCHGGERLALDADVAHSSMRGGANPSDFSVVQQSCGRQRLSLRQRRRTARPHPARHDQRAIHLRRGDREHPVHLRRAA